MRHTAILAILAPTVLLGACASSKPHARMTAPAIEASLEDEFPVGTPRDSVISRLRRQGATYDSPLPLSDPAGWSTMRVYFDQPWWAGLQWTTTYRKTEAWADMLFDQGQILREVQAEVREETW